MTARLLVRPRYETLLSLTPSNLAHQPPEQGVALPYSQKLYNVYAILITQLYGIMICRTMFRSENG